jgi:UDP-glucose 4-epimerase
MKVTVTGAFGNVGTSAVEELLRRGHTVRSFDLPTRRNRRRARRLPRRVDVVWGDLRNRNDVRACLSGQEAVAHLAFIIPKMSATGVESEARPEWAREINVGGTWNVIEAMRSECPLAKVIFTSSFHVYGRTQDQAPPRTVLDSVRATEHYSQHKIDCEAMVRSSGLDWAIFRLAATLPIAIQLDPGMFDVPLPNRIEFVHTRDVGLAIANGVSHPGVWGKVLNIGGGPSCQFLYGEMVERILDRMGLGTLPDGAFGTVPFPTDWLDTAESQSLLSYQRRDLSHYLDDMSTLLGYRRRLIRAFRPIVRAWVLKKSPYFGTGPVRSAKPNLATEPG